MATAKEILAVALAELGVMEAPANSNNVKYNTAYYGQEVWDGKAGGKYPWCMVFQWWLFHQAEADGLFYGGRKTASCGTLMDYARAHGQLVTSGYQPGDLLFLRFSAKRTRPEHVGLLKEMRSGGTYITIEGNTGLDDDANGGQVQQRVRYAWQVLGAYRPHYDKEDEMDIEKLTDDQLIRLAERMQAALAKRPISTTLAAEVKEAVALGITDGSNPNKFCTRAQCAAMIRRVLLTTH